MTEEKGGGRPFVRNRYYPGKMLYAGDFTSDQEYYNGKIRWTRKYFFGSGVVFGLETAGRGAGVVCLSGGCAVDGLGREIIVADSQEVELSGLPGWEGRDGGRLILGIAYEERDLDAVPCALDRQEKYYATRTEESWRLALYTEAAWREREEERRLYLSSFFDRQVLFQDEAVRITQITPRTVAADKSFRITFLAEPLAGPADCRFSASCMLENGSFLSGGGRSADSAGGQAKDGFEKEAEENPVNAFFSYYQVSGNAFLTGEQVLAEAEALPAQGRETLLLRTANVDVASGGRHNENSGMCQASMHAVRDYEETVRRELERMVRAERPCPEQWIPLAAILFGGSCAEPGEIRTEDLRHFAANPRVEADIRAVRSTSGIRDIHSARRPEPPWPYPPAPFPPAPPPHPCPPPPPPFSREEWEEWLREERESRIRHGVAVITVPKHYRRGQVVCSDEIAHGFPGERVAVWYGRLWKEEPYAYWEKEKASHTMTQGQETAFEPEEGRGWLVKSQSLRLHLERGTFQIAVRLKKRWWKKREREIAIAWTAVRIT